MLRVVKSSGPLALLRRNEWVWVRTVHISKHFAWHLSYECQSCICAKMRCAQITKLPASPEETRKCWFERTEPSEIDETHFDNGR